MNRAGHRLPVGGPVGVEPRDAITPAVTGRIKRTRRQSLAVFENEMVTGVQLHRKLHAERDDDQCPCEEYREEDDDGCDKILERDR